MLKHNNIDTDRYRRFVAPTYMYPPCWVLKARIQKHRGKPLLYHNKCPGFFYEHYTTHGTYSFTSHLKDEAIMVKCLAQGHKQLEFTLTHPLGFHSSILQINIIWVKYLYVYTYFFLNIYGLHKSCGDISPLRRDSILDFCRSPVMIWFPIKSHRSGVFPNNCKGLYFWPTGKYMIHCIRGDQISHIQSMVAKRGFTNQANVHTSMWKSHLKHSTAQFQSIQQFWLQLDIVLKQKKEDFFGLMCI